MDWSQVSQNLANLPNNPLFNLGLGMLSTPYQRAPVSFGQVLGNGVAQMDYAKQQQAKQQQAALQAKMLQMRYQDQVNADQSAQQQSQAAAALAQNLGPNATPYEKYLAQYDPSGYARLEQMKQQQSKPIFDSNAGVLVNPQTATFRPVVSATGVGVPPTVPRVGMPSNGAFQASTTSPGGQRVSFNFPAGTPPQVIAAAEADARAHGDLAPDANLVNTAPQTLEAYKAAQANHAGYRMLSPTEVQAMGLPAGTVAQQAANGQIHILSKGSFQGGSSTELPGDGTLTGQDYVQSIPDPGQRALVMSYLTGNNPPPSGTALKNTAIRSAWAAALHADPSLSAGTYAMRLNNRKAFVDGKEGQVINRINTAIGHLGEYIGQVKQLDEGSLKPWNAISNYAKDVTGNTTLNQIQTIVPNLASEVAYVYNGGVPAEGEVKERQQAFNPNRGAKANIANAVETIKLLQSKLDAMQSQYEQGAGKFAEPLTMINPQAREAEAKLRALAAELGVKDGQGVGQPAEASGMPQVGDVEGGFRYKGGDPSSPSSWVKVQ